MPLQIEDSKWKQFKSRVRSRYSKIRDFEIERSKGKLDLLAKKIRSLYRKDKIDPEVELDEYAKESKLSK